MNPTEFIQMIQRSANPQLAVLDLLERQMGNTPMGKNLINLARSGKSGDIEKIARNMMKAQGRDFDKEFANFKQMFGFR